MPKSREVGHHGELRDREYVEVADVSGDEDWTAEAPYPVTVRPADLLK
jgi:hypothetical protein